ncbi:MAG: helix-turn-helix domain containing protein [Butyricicoccus sp.]|nr:helix-turn-helix domain containing protein [Butyricicoccus sp.]
MKYSWEYKLECIRKYRQGEWPETPDGISKKEFRDKIRKWVRLEDSCGSEMLKHKSHSKEWTPEEKLELISKVLAGHSCNEVAITVGINSGQLCNWIKKYKIEGYEGLVTQRKGRPPKEFPMKKKVDPTPLTESEREELIRLRAEIEYWKTENAVIKKEIALRQERMAAQLKAKKQRLSKNSEKKDIN